MFLLVWSDEAFEEMARIVRLYPARKHEFATALRQVTHQLSTDPLNRGESREEEMRVMFAGDLSVFYAVDEASRVVEIGLVRLRTP
ncbi:type II toxin-antitoxin system RelE/ParE family toxin [Gemmata sp.]|uniref:type II toxin-antitoxin system RelE/ParE family toxin n=1 Tax=Gemmata sp. TaxID=1914242 RepID=UPI003F720701